ncbi:MAG: DUF3667 domain-containing protein [Vicingaceae bacterium]
MNAIKVENCLNCGNELSKDDQFCSQCGQSTERESNLRSFVSHFLSDYFTFDSMIFKSVRPLFVKPGFLTLEYLKGKRVSYIPPLRLFIFSSIVFFLLLSLLDGGSESESFKAGSEDYYWDRFFESWLPKLFFILSPLFSLLLALFFRKDRWALKHFVFSIHYHATIFCIGSVYLLISWFMALFSLQLVNFVIVGLIVIYLLSYLFIALKRVYRQKVKQLIWKLPLLGFFYTLLIGVSVFLLILISR